MDNEAQTNVTRKQGLIIWTGANPTKDMKLQWQREARAKYGLTSEQVKLKRPLMFMYPRAR